MTEYKVYNVCQKKSHTLQEENASSNLEQLEEIMKKHAELKL